MIAGWKQRHYTQEDYLALVDSGALECEKVELIRGEIRPMSPQGPMHAWGISLINTELVVRFRQSYIIFPQSTLPLPDGSCPEPDFAIFQGMAVSRDRPPLSTCLASIEVSDSSLAYDRGVKAQLYSEAGVPEYWIINLVDRQIEVHRDPSPEGYRTRTIHQPGEEVAFHFAPDQPIAVAEVLP